MPTSDELRLFMQERLRAMDSTIRLDPGSPASTQVIEPLVRRFEPDALETDLVLFIRTRLMQEYPDLQSGEGSVVSDFLVKPLTVLFEPLVREIRSVKKNQSLIDPEILNRDEVDSIVANIFVTREIGDYAKVVVRAYFLNALTVNIGSSNIAYTATGLRFLPTQAQTITAEGMLFNQEGNLYYFDISYVAEAPGKSYNVDPDSVTGITNLTAATRVTNIRQAESGLDEETSIQVISKSEQSIGERSLTTAPGAVSRLFEQFPQLKVLNAVGFNDEDMHRDVIAGGSLGEALYWGTGGASVDDGNSDNRTPYFDAPTGAFTTRFGPIGTDISDYVITLWMGDQPFDFNLKEVVSTTRVSISDSYANEDTIIEPIASIEWVIRKRVITLSDIPGGIIFPDNSGTTLDVPPNEIHVGGCTDFFVSGAGDEDATQLVALLGPYEPIDHETTTVEPGFRRLQATTYGAAGFGNNRINLVNIAALDMAKVIPGITTIRLLSGSDPGIYRVIAKTGSTAYVDRDLSVSETDLLYDMFNEITINLADPQETIYKGDDLRTYAGSSVVDTLSGLSWSDYGVGIGQWIEILTGDDAEDYEIDAVAGSQLTVLGTMQNTASPITYRIYNKQDESLELPLVRVRSVELLDSGMSPTGSFVPYREPIDARSTSFQNPGRGAKVGTDVIVTENTTMSATSGSATIECSNTSLNFYDLGVRVGDLINITTTDNQGFHTIEEVGGVGALDSYKLVLTEVLDWTASGMEYEVGEASHGVFRVYFAEPCSFSVTYADSIVSVTLGDGTVRRFRPDPSIWDEYLPSDTVTAVCTMTDDSNIITLYTSGGAASILPNEYQIFPNDRAEITYAPIVGSLDLEPGGIDLDGKNILLDLGSGSERIHFQGASLSVDDIIGQINTQASRSIATKYTIAGAPDQYYIMLRSDQEVALKDNSANGNDCTADIFGTTRATYMSWLAGVFADQDTSNDSPIKGYYLVSAVLSTSSGDVYLKNTDLSSFDPDLTISDTQLAHFVKFSKEGQQSISATDMNSNLDSMGLYYFDIECISEGYGDVWNINPDLKGVVTGHYSEGWSITSEDSDLTFSMAEVPWLHINNRLIFVGTSDDPNNYEELSGRNYQITYERSPLVESVHSFVRDVQERVTCMSPLARHLLPIYFRTFIQYQGGPDESDARTALVDIAEGVAPEQQLEVSDFVSELYKLDAQYVVLPIEFVGISHGVDRAISVQRSENIILPGSLSVIIPDDDDTTSESAGFIVLEKTTA